MGRVGGANSEKSPKQDEASPVLEGAGVPRWSQFVLGGDKARAFTGYTGHKPHDRDHSAAALVARLRRDTVVILRLEGVDLEEFVGGPAASLRERVRAALGLLTVDHGMPPSSDPWVIENVVEPAMGFISAELLEQPVSLEGFAIVFKTIVEGLARRLKDHPVIVACCEDTFDGSDINWLLSDKRDLHKLLNSAWGAVGKENEQATPKEFLYHVLNKVLLLAGLPPYGTISQLNAIIDESYKETNSSDSRVDHKEDLENMMKGILQNIMNKLEKNPISVSSTTVVNEYSCQPVC